MPLSGSLEKSGLVEGIRKLRKRPLATYGIAVGAVVLATALRAAVGGQLMAGLPFITYYPAVIIAALVGGFSRGVLAIILSVVASWFLFLPPLGSWSLESSAALSLIFFALMALLNVGIVYILDAAVDRAFAQEQNVRTLIQAAPNGILVVDDAGRITLVNASLERLFGYKGEELLGRHVDLLVNEASQLKHRALRQEYMRHPEARAMGQGRDLSARHKDGGEFPVEIGLNPINRNGGTGVLATVIDISERVRAHEAQSLVIRELHHRTQNLFAVMWAMIGRSLDEAKTPAEAKYTLKGRVHALAQAYATVSNAAGSRTSLKRFLAQQLAPFSDRISLSGCDVSVTPSSAQQFALIVHELATNALKYGALSVPSGKVLIEGTVTRADGSGQLLFVWKEVGGPPASAPSHRGFGSVILMDVAKQWADDVSADLSKEGLTYTLRLPLDLIEPNLGAGVAPGAEVATNIAAMRARPQSGSHEPL